MLFTLLCVTTLAMSFDGYGPGSVFRAVRLFIFVAILWLITPWWGQGDGLGLCRIHRNALVVILTTVVVGMFIAPGRAFAQATGSRLGGTLWPVPPTQVAHYAAVITGLTIVMWLSKTLSLRWAMPVTVVSFVVLILTHTRTALVGTLVGVLIAGISLFTTRRRVRQAFAVALVVSAVVVVCFAPFIVHWFARGESNQQLTGLTGRSTVWTEVLAQPRTEVHVLFGFGPSNDSFNGLAIDSSWISTYLDQGLVGDVIIGSALLLVLLKALFSPRGPGRAIALFLVCYCLVASFTETGLGDASPYILDLAVAVSVLVQPLLASKAVLTE
jgi:hypothetical protein